MLRLYTAASLAHRAMLQSPNWTVPSRRRQSGTSAKYGLGKEKDDETKYGLGSMFKSSETVGVLVGFPSAGRPLGRFEGVDERPSFDHLHHLEQALDDLHRLARWAFEYFSDGYKQRGAFEHTSDGKKQFATTVLPCNNVKDRKEKLLTEDCSGAAVESVLIVGQEVEGLTDSIR